MDWFDAFDFNDAPALALRFVEVVVLALAFVAKVVFAEFLAPALVYAAVYFVDFFDLGAGLTELADYC